MRVTNVGYAIFVIEKFLARGNLYELSCSQGITSEIVNSQLWRDMSQTLYRLALF